MDVDGSYGRVLVEFIEVDWDYFFGDWVMMDGVVLVWLEYY